MYFTRNILLLTSTATGSTRFLHVFPTCPHASNASPTRFTRPTQTPSRFIWRQVGGKKTRVTIDYDDLPSRPTRGRLASAAALAIPSPTDHVQATGQRHGARKKIAVDIQDSTSDIPQGLIPLDPLPLEDEGPTYPTVILQARRNMQKFENCVLLTRVGGFYELYFEHADEYGRLMNLKVATKVTKGGPVPMVPYFIPGEFCQY
jgi:hypothetical protein